MSLALADIAARGGLTVQRHGLTPCPVCGAEKRGREDRRPPVSTFVRDGEERWHCKAGGCGAGGGAGALLAAVRFHQILPKGDPRWAEVMAELDGTRTHRSENLPARASASQRKPLHPSTAPSTHPEPGRVRATTSRNPTPAHRPYPPAPEVHALWSASRRLDAVPASDAAARYLTSRGLDAHRCGLLDLSRVTAPPDAWPRWIPLAGLSRTEWAHTYRIVTPMIDAAGEIRSLRFRAVGDVPTGKKALNPNGYGYAGLVMADPLGAALLRGERVDEGVAWDGRVVVVEGEPDFWTWSCHPARFGSPTTWAVLGVVSGSWSEALADRIPDRARVILRTHHDAPGEKYAERIRGTLSGRCEILRSTPPSDHHAESRPQEIA